MFTSRRKKAIGLFTKRRSEIDKIQTMTAYERWRVRANAVVKQYIGENDFHRQNFAKVDLTVMPSLKDEKRKSAWIRSQKILAKEYMNSCIDYLNNDGKMVREPSLFGLLPVAQQVAIAIFGAGFFFSIGYYTIVNKRTFENEYNECNKKFESLKHSYDSLTQINRQPVDTTNKLLQPRNKANEKD